MLPRRKESSIEIRPFCTVNDHCVERTIRWLQFQAKLLDGREDIRGPVDVGIYRSWFGWRDSRTLDYKLQIEVVPSRKSGFVFHRSVQYDALQQ